jgi:adenylyl-sulfate kinase
VGRLGRESIRSASNRDATQCLQSSADARLVAVTRAGLRGLAHRPLWCGEDDLANLISAELERRGRLVEALDGDIVRTHLSRGLGFSKEDRDTNVERIGWVASRLARAGVAVVVSAISPYEEARGRARALTQAFGRPFLCVWVRASVETCAARDDKGLYARALAGELADFTGVTAPYEEPETADLVLDSENRSPEENAAVVMCELERLELI